MGSTLPVTGISYRPRTAETKWLIVHDSHTEPGQQRMLEWLKVTGRGMGLLHIGYHYVIFEDGELVACRPAHQIGSACRGFNHNAIQVCLIGGLRYRPGPDGEAIPHHCDTFTPQQKAKLVELFRYVRQEWPGIELKGHTELGHHKHRHSELPCPALNMEAIRQLCDPTHSSPSSSS